MIIKYVISLCSAVIFSLAMPGQLFEQGSVILGIIGLAPYFYVLLSTQDRRVAAGCGFIMGVANSVATYYWLIFYRDFALWTISSVSLAHGIAQIILALVIFRVRIYNRAWRPFVIAILWGGYEYMKSVGYLALPLGNGGLTTTKSLIFIQHIELTGVWTLNFMVALGNALVAELLLSRHARGGVKYARPEEAAYAGRGTLPARSSALRAHARRQAKKHGVDELLLADSAVAIADGRRFAIARSAPDEKDGKEVAMRQRYTSLPWIGRQTLCLVTMVALAMLFGAVRLHYRLPVEERIPMLIAQQNTDAWTEGTKAAITSNIRLSREALAEVAAEGRRPPELIIWSENSVGYSYRENRGRYESWPENDPLVPFIIEYDIPLLTGSPYVGHDDDGNRRVYNSAVLINGEGDFLDYYGKRHLIPFAEHVPFWSYEWARKFYTTVVGLGGTWDIGTAKPIMTLAREGGRGTMTFGTLICFEDTFGYLGRDIALRGGEFMINLTNNAWSRRRGAQIQHLSLGRLRTIETRRASVRSTNSGESVVVNAYGEIEARLPSLEKDYLLVDVPTYDAGITLYTHYGDYLGHLLMWSGLLLWTLCFVSRARRRLM